MAKIPNVDTDRGMERRTAGGRTVSDNKSVDGMAYRMEVGRKEYVDNCRTNGDKQICK